MAQHFFGSLTDCFTESDKVALQCILDRKIMGIAPGLRGEKTLTIDLITRGVDPLTNDKLHLFPFPS